MPTLFRYDESLYGNGTIHRSDIIQILHVCADQRALNGTGETIRLRC